MSPLELPPPGEIDRRRAALIAPVVLGNLLQLPLDQQVVAARINSSGDIELLVEGARLPERREGEEPQPLQLICALEEPDRERRLQRTWYAWSHDRETRWLGQLHQFEEVPPASSRTRSGVVA